MNRRTSLEKIVKIIDFYSVGTCLILWSIFHCQIASTSLIEYLPLLANAALNAEFIVESDSSIFLLLLSNGEITHLFFIAD